jgi:hypothetical protein
MRSPKDDSLPTTTAQLALTRTFDSPRAASTERAPILIGSGSGAPIGITLTARRP